MKAQYQPPLLGVQGSQLSSRGPPGRVLGVLRCWCGAPGAGGKQQLPLENSLCARHVAGVIAFRSHQKLQPVGAVYLPFHVRVRGAELCQTQALCEGTSRCSARVPGQIAKQPLEVGLMSPFHRRGDGLALVLSSRSPGCFACTLTL